MSGLEHLSASMPAACYATKHIVHDMDTCFGVYNLFGLNMAAAAAPAGGPPTSEKKKRGNSDFDRPKSRNSAPAAFL